ncbi:MAG: metallophosphoesterase [Clostridiales bacterium]|nr:metallophosphoesterase [Clostridiales bacterium]
MTLLTYIFKKIDFRTEKKVKILNILHISDAHIQKKDESAIAQVAEKLIQDVLKVQVDKKLKINLVCFTGDLIQRGDKAVEDEKQLEIAKRILVEPLLTALGLDKKQFLLVPGNHEVDISKIIKATEKGLLVTSLEEIDENIKEMNSTYLSRLEYFYSELPKVYDDIIQEKIGYAFIREINGVKIGIACIDSAWRSSGKGGCEKMLMYIGRKQVQDLYKHIEKANFKICMMHHPLDWLSDYESNLIEREMTKFDIVLRGHVHETDTKEICRQNIKTIYCTAGKLYPLDYAYGRNVDGYNGYSILNVNFETNLCTVFMRTYFAKERQAFDSAIDVIPEGEIVYELNGNTKDKQMEFNIVKGIKEYFLKMSETITMINEIDSKSPINIEQVFIEPILSEESEYKKEKQNKEAKITLQQLLNDKDNLIIIGKKESGKTTVLQKLGLMYIERYEGKALLPIHIDMRQLSKKGDRLLLAAQHFVMNNMFDEADINKAKVNELIELGKIVFLIDNVDISNEDHTNILTKFIEDHKNNRFIMTVKEGFFQSLELKKIPEYGQVFRKIFIHLLGKAQIRQMVTKWADKNDNTVNINDVVEKIDGYCNQINFAKTPFNISIFMVLWDSDKNFIPQNEAIVMENYLEILLEKLSPDESDRSNYSFQVKQHFLSTMAYKMFQKDQYYFTVEEFENLICEYHKTKGYKENDTHFSTLFFNKGILCYFDTNIVFSHTSMLEYFLAVYAKNNNEFLQIMLKKGNRVNFRNEICFYSGLTPDCGELLDSMADTIIEAITGNIDVVDKLNDIEIMAEFRLNKDELIKNLNENRPSQNDIDKMSDLSSQKKEVAPTEINKAPKLDVPQIIDAESDEIDKEQGEKETEDFYSLIQMYGSVLKNAELLDNKDKIIHLENYMYAMNIFLAEVIQIARILKEKMKYDEFKDMIKETNEVPTEEEFEDTKTAFMEIAKLSFPIAIQNVIFESVGTPKLEMAINDLMSKKTEKPFEKFMFVFLKCDLQIGNIIAELKRYIRTETSESILKLILNKLIFYYRMRFFGVNKKMDDDLLDLLIEINMKLNPNENKNLISQIKGRREWARTEMARQIEKSKMVI